jgi:hypothetical protein
MGGGATGALGFAISASNDRKPSWLWRKRDRPGAHRSEKELDELGAIPDQHGHALARAHAEPRQHARDLIHPLVELPVGGATLSAPEQVDDRNLVGYAGSGLVEEKAEIAPAIRIVHVAHARLAAVRADMREREASSNAARSPPLLSVAVPGSGARL